MMSAHQAAASQTSHDQLQAVLDAAGVALRASEVHGMICGELCRQVKAGTAARFPELLGLQDAAAEPARAVLDAVDELSERTRRSLEGGLQFSLLLPDDAEPIEARTGSVADWARGFAVALLRGDEVRLDRLEDNSAEVVRDFMKISEAEAEEESEENERALAEVEEYLRVGVQLVFEELHPDDRQPPDRSTH